MMPLPAAAANKLRTKKRPLTCQHRREKGRFLFICCRYTVSDARVVRFAAEDFASLRWRFDLRKKNSS